MEAMDLEMEPCCGQKKKPRNSACLELGCGCLGGNFLPLPSIRLNEAGRV